MASVLSKIIDFLYTTEYTEVGAEKTEEIKNNK
jgi:hypothetical protein